MTWITRVGKSVRHRSPPRCCCGAASLTAGARRRARSRSASAWRLTGGLAANGKAALLAMQIWEEDTNAKGGLLGRPVKLIYYDDQSNPATVPGIFTKLLDVDKVDLVIGDYGTNLLAPAMPVVIQHKMTFFALFGLDVNREFQYPKYFAMQPAGGMDPPVSLLQGFLRDRDGAGPQAQDAGDHRRGCRIPAQRRRRRAQERQGGRPARSSTTRPIRRPRPTTPRSCGRSTQPMPMS